MINIAQERIYPTPTSLSNNPRITLIRVQVGRNVLPQLLKNEGASREMQRGKARMGNSLCDDLRGGSGHELDDARGQTGFLENFIHNVVRVRRHGRRLPDHDISH
jgi:hypothetical protein